MKKILVYFMVAISIMFGVAGIAPTEASAADGIVKSPSNCGNNGDSGGGYFFALKPWYRGLTTESGGKCSIGEPLDGKIPEFIWTIVLNILFDISVIVGYLAVLMVAWGGYLYMFSRGEVGRAEKGKKTLIAAVAGLVIAVLASVIMNTIVTILTSTS